MTDKYSNPVLIARESSQRLMQKAEELANKSLEQLEQGNVKAAERLTKLAEKIIEQLGNPERQRSRDR